MPIGGDLLGGRIGYKYLPERDLPLPTSHRANAIRMDQTRFFNGGPMMPTMQDRWASNLGSYGPYGDRQWRRNPPYLPRIPW